MEPQSSLPPMVNSFTGPFASEITEKKVEDEVKDLSSTLTAIRSVLAHVEEQQEVASNSVTDWLVKLKYVAYDMEDVVEEFASENLQAKLEGGVRNLHLEKETEKQIKEIRKKLDMVMMERRLFQLAGGDAKTGKDKQQRATSSSLVKSNVYGREDDERKLIQLLLWRQPRGENPSVIPIVGMGGIGKTTLAQLAYNSQDIQHHFDVKAWVCVSEPFDVVRITKAVIESITGESCSLLELDPLHRQLKGLLVGKKFLLVLDDVWSENENDWDLLCVPLRFSVEGSKILLTTRSQRVAKLLGTCTPHDLKILSFEDSWRLFTQKALSGESFDEYPDQLEEIGKKVVDRCGGLPLAVRVMGGMFASKRKVSQWKQILDNSLWELSGGGSILPILKLSYDHLQAPLQSCFKYCSLFPKDYTFARDVLVGLWVSERYILPEDGRDEEEIGNEYFNELVMVSFMQNDGWGTGYKMHDLVHDLAEHAWKDEFIRVDGGMRPVIRKQNIVRHASFFSCKNPQDVNFDGISCCEKLRTFLYLDSYIFALGRGRTALAIRKPDYLDSIVRLKCLRVLCLRQCGIEELPREIGCLKLLRHLDISRNPIQELPESICTLYNLEIFVMDKCANLIELPERIWNLRNLQKLSMDCCVTLLPQGIGKLTKLRELPSFQVVSPEKTSESLTIAFSGRISELKDMFDLRGEIMIGGLEHVSSGEEAKEANMKSKVQLKGLLLTWSRDLQKPCKPEDVIDGLQPHVNLERLRISRYNGGRLPSWLQQPLLYKLKRLGLDLLDKLDTVYPLGCLPHLTELNLLRMNSLTGFGAETDHGRDAPLFPKLEKLTLFGLHSLRDWSGLQHGDMPCLSQLVLYACEMVTELPLAVFSNLKELFLCDLLAFSSELKLPSLENLHLIALPHILQKSAPFLSSLKSLQVTEFSNLDCISSLTSLKKLAINHCEDLESLPHDLSKLRCLKELELTACPRLASLPDNVLPNSLECLWIDRCPLLQQRVGDGTGVDSDKE